MRPAMLAAALVPALALLALQPALAKPAAKHAAAPPADAPPAAAQGDAAAKGDAAAPADAAPDPDPTLTDLKCMVVAGVLLGADDEQMRSLGRASLFYYLGRLQGRGDTANLDARIVDVAGKMSEAEINAQSRSCGARFTAATQALQSLNDALAQHFGGTGGAGAPK